MHLLKCEVCGADAHAPVEESLTAETQWCPLCNEFTAHSADVIMVDVFDNQGNVRYSAAWNSKLVRDAWESGATMRRSSKQ